MLRIYDESQFRNRTQLKRLQVIALFVGGTLSGAWLSGAGGQWPLLQDAFAMGSQVQQRPASTLKPLRSGASRSCFSNETRGLKLDCQLSAPELQRANGI